MGAVLADSGLMGLASATEAGSARVLGPGAVPLLLTVNGQPGEAGERGGRAGSGQGVRGRCDPASKNGYKVPVLEAVVRRTILAAAG
jgi:hypothetical protein